MPFVRPQSTWQAARLLARSQFKPTSRTLATSSARQAGASHGHEDHYDPPGGWLWGVPPGQKPEKEGWETLWTVGFFGSLVVATIAYAFKPDTSIQTWALEEARRRLEKEGILADPDEKQ